MHRYALFGDRINGSLSPELHRHSWAQSGTDADYELWSMRPEDLGDFVERARVELAGFNLTAPFKQQIVPYLDEQTLRANDLGSVNTVRVHKGRLIGENTDWHGVCATLERIKTPVGPAMILGSGGVVPTVIDGLRRFGFGPVTVCCRRPESIDRAMVGAVDHVKSFDDRHELSQGQALVINATPLGGTPDDPLPMHSAEVDGPAHWDLMYRPVGTTAWVEAALRAGIVALDGRVMLIEQAIESQRFWGFDEQDAESMRQLWLIE